MPWSSDIQALTEVLTDLLIELCRQETGSMRKIGPDTDPCRDLGICDEDLDDIQIKAAGATDLRLPFSGEALIIPWHGPERATTIADLAAWIAVNSRPIQQPDGSRCAAEDMNG